MSAFNLGGIFVLLSFSVFQCFASNDTACAGLLQISPSRLVVRFGDPASAFCTITQDPTEPHLFSWEASTGGTLPISGPRNRTWQADMMDQWDTAPQCYSTFPPEDLQCLRTLNLTVYKLPDSIELQAEMEDMVEGREYTVKCSIKQVAPMQRLKVRFYRGDTLLDTQGPPETRELKPQSADFLLTVTAREEDDGSELWCEASLDLDLEDTPGNKSARVRTSVLYRPRIHPTHLDSKQPVSITEGDTLELKCRARANPAPSYSWTLPQGLSHALDTDVLILPLVKHTGNYTCTVRNSQGTDAVTYLVEVKVDWLPIIAGLVGAVILVVIIIGCFIFKAHYNQTRTGRYDLRNIFQSLKAASNHVALSNGSPL